MSSTEYKVDRKDIWFMLKEVFKIEELCELPDFTEFSGDLPEMIVEEAAQFSEKILAPINQSGDREGCTQEGDSVIMPSGFADAWKQCAEGGWVGLSMSTEFGGQGAPELLSTAVREAMFGANQSFLITHTLTTGAAGLIHTFGSDAQKQLYCEKMFSGEWTGSMCLTEPHAGSAVGDIKTSATPKEDYHLIKGTKQYITSGEHNMTDNIIHLVLARIPGSPEGVKGISLFVVPKFRPDGSRNDVHVVSLEHKMGMHASPTCLMAFGENDDCHGYLLEAENRGMMQMFQMMNEARLFVGVQGLGASAAATQYAQAFANERVQGVAIEAGKTSDAQRVPIVKHPDIRRTLMHMKAMTEGIRGILYASAIYADLSEHGPEDTKNYYQDLVDFHIPIAKSFATDEGFDVAAMGIQILGGMGYTKDFPLEQNVRDLKIASIYEGTNGIQALDLVGRKFRIHDGRLIESMNQMLQELDSVQLPAMIQPWYDTWKSYLELAQESIQGLQQMETSHGPQGYVLYAKNMLNIMGDVLAAFYLLKQAVAAHVHWEPHVGSDPAEVCKNSPEARFYWNKLKTTEFYVNGILPRVAGQAQIIKNANVSPLEAYLEEE